MFKNKSSYKPIQFIPKNNEQTNNPVKKKDTKLSYEEIRKIIENKNEKEILNNNQETSMKQNNKFNIV